MKRFILGFTALAMLAGCNSGSTTHSKSVALSPAAGVYVGQTAKGGGEDSAFALVTNSNEYYLYESGQGMMHGFAAVNGDNASLVDENGAFYPFLGAGGNPLISGQTGWRTLESTYYPGQSLSADIYSAKNNTKFGDDVVKTWVNSTSLQFVNLKSIQKKNVLGTYVGQLYYGGVVQNIVLRLVPPSEENSTQEKKWVAIKGLIYHKSGSPQAFTNYCPLDGKVSLSAIAGVMNFNVSVTPPTKLDTAPATCSENLAGETFAGKIVSFSTHSQFPTHFNHLVFMGLNVQDHTLGFVLNSPKCPYWDTAKGQCVADPHPN